MHLKIELRKRARKKQQHTNHNVPSVHFLVNLNTFRKVTNRKLLKLSKNKSAIRPLIRIIYTLEGREQY